MRGIFLLLAVLATSAHAATPNFSSLPMSFSDRTHGMSFFDKGWFSEASYPVKFQTGVWKCFVGGEWLELSTPFVGKWNTLYHLVLDRGGKVFVVAKDGSRRWEIRWLDGEWKENVGGDTEWTSLADDYEIGH